MMGTFGSGLLQFTTQNPNYNGFSGMAYVNQPVHSLLLDQQTHRLYMGGAFTENMGSPLPSVGYISLSPNAAPKELAMQKLAVYPNPVNAQAQIKADAEGNEALTFEVYNVLGQKVQQWQENKAADGIYALTKGQLGTGTYLLNVQQVA
ncbi:MAG: T9SS type A sorting domain-containing protein, partial [Sphingobacteriales bacterium]